MKSKIIFPIGLMLTLLIHTILHAQSHKPLVVASASIFADMAEQIGGDIIEVRSIVPIGGDPHTYEATPADATLVAKADLILMNGLTFEGWISELVQNSGTKAQVEIITQGIQPISSNVYTNSSDPHAWMDAQNGKVYAQNIYNALIALVPDQKPFLERQYQAYSQQLSKLHEYIQQRIAKIPEDQRILITSHDAFHYFGKQYGIRTEAILGTSTDADAQTGDIIRINKIIKDQRIPAVFIESTVNPKLLNSIARDNDIQIGGKLYSDSLGDRNSPAATYIAMLKYNTDVIVDGLTRIHSGLTSEHAGGLSYGWLIVLGAAMLAGFLLVLKFIK